jgi:uncharacterized C2H2 Zn-finger protein
MTDFTFGDATGTGTQKELECDECGKIFKKQSKLNRHKASIHENIRPFACDQVGC